MSSAQDSSCRQVAVSALPSKATSARAKITAAANTSPILVRSSVWHCTGRAAISGGTTLETYLRTSFETRSASVAAEMSRKYLASWSMCRGWELSYIGGGDLLQMNDGDNIVTS